MINATYTDVLAEIREFFAQHLLVNSFIDGQLYDFQAKENVYSSVVLVPTPSQVQNTQLNLAFDLYFVDRINEDGSNTRDVYNDELQIAQDFIAYFSNRRDNWNLDPENINIEPFEQKFADLLGGWRLSVSVLLPFYKNVCDIPLDEDAPVPPTPPTPPTPPVFKRNHADLRNLDYEHAGHTGFQKALSSDNAGNNITITHDAQGNAIINAQVPSAAVWGNISGNLEDQTDLTNALNSKQGTLTAGTNININENNVISATDTTYSQGTGITIDANNVISNNVSSLVPAQASVNNQLADKDFVNSSIATSTATFMGTVTAADDTEAAAQSALSSITGMDDNDYAFVKVPNTPQIGVDKFKRYKYNGTIWEYEYTLNNSSFTSAQWYAINSGITSGKVTTYDEYATTKQDTLIAGTNITIGADGKTISSDIPQATSQVAGKVLLGAAGGAATYESVNDRPPICYPTTADNVGATIMDLKSSVSDNGSKLTEVGFVYSDSNQNPTVNDTKAICDLGVGRIEKSLSGLMYNTTYYIKSYGINQGGTSYGDLFTRATSLNYINYGLILHLDCRDFDYGTNKIIDRINGIEFIGANITDMNIGMGFLGTSNLSENVNTRGDFVLPLSSSTTIEACFKADLTQQNGYMLFQPYDISSAYMYNHAQSESKYYMWLGRQNPIYLLPSTQTGSVLRSVSLNYYEGCCNGTLLTITTSASYTNAGFTNYMRIGSRGDGSWQFFGTLYSLRIYNRILTNDEILSNQQVDTILFGN